LENDLKENRRQHRLLKTLFFLHLVLLFNLFLALRFSNLPRASFVSKGVCVQNLMS